MIDRTKGEVYRDSTSPGSYKKKLHRDARDRKLEQYCICRVCRKTAAETKIELHHIKPIEEFPDDTPCAVINAPENTVFLCKECHNQIHYEKKQLPPPIKVEIII